MRKYIAILGLLAALLLSGCQADEMPDTAGPSETSDTVQAVSATSSTDEAESGEDTDAEESKNPYKGPEDFYINVTDCNGDEKIVFYTCGDEENDTCVYIQDKMDDPESHFGIISYVSQDMPAKMDTAFFGDKLRTFADQSYLGYAAISYFYLDSGFASSSQVVDANVEPEKYEKLIDSLCSFEPEFVPELAGEKSNSPVDATVNVYDKTVIGNYDKRHPLNSLNIYPGNIRHYRTLMTATQVSMYSLPSINLSFSRYEDRTICRMRVIDYREIQKLTMSEKQPPSPEELEKAYYESTYYVSDWFYVDNAEFYDLALKYVLLSDKNEFSGVRQKHDDDGYSSTMGFSENIAAHLNTSGKVPEGYETRQISGIYFIIPENGEITMDSDVIFKWENYDNGELIFRLCQTVSAGSRNQVIVSEVGKFNNEYCTYRSLYNETKEKYYWDEVSFNDPDGNRWTASFKYTSDERTAEYDTIVKNVLGSISLYAGGEQGADVKIKLASEPSVYEDTSELADSYSYNGRDVYRAYRPGVIFVDFYVLDFTKDYETGFECYLEKQEADGLWYRVEPLGGGMTQINPGSGHFYNALETGRRFITADLAAYPLLPPGSYRFAKPFWEKGSADHEQYMAFYEFRMDEKISLGDDITGSAECSQDTYAPGVREITYTVNVDAESFVVSEIYDIERLENGEWVSVREGPISTNSIGGSYSMRFSGMTETVSTNGFDLSEPGEYRIRISIGEYDYETDENMLVDNYDTVYAYFSIRE